MIVLKNDEVVRVKCSLSDHIYFWFLLLKALLTYKSLTQKEKLIENNLKHINTMQSDTHKEDNVSVKITYKGQNAELN